MQKLKTRFHCWKNVIGPIASILLISMGLSGYGQEAQNTYRSLEATRGQEDEVTKLILSDTYYHSLPEEIFNLTNLKSLDLSNADPVVLNKETLEAVRKLESKSFGYFDAPRSGLIELDPRISELRNLEEIILNGNPNLDFQKVFETLSNLPNLKILAIMNNGIRELPPNVTELKTLEQIWLGRNNDLNVPSALSALGRVSNLKHLGFGGMEINELSFGPNTFQSLENLWLAGNNLSKLDGLDNLHNLKSITLNNNQLKKVPGQLAGARNLEFVGLNNNPDLNVQHMIKVLSKLPKLRAVSLNGNNLKSIKGMERLKSLEFLVIKGNDISPEEIADFKEANPTMKVITE